MNRAATLCFVWSVLAISFSASAGTSPTGPEVRINVYNDAQLPDHLLTEALQEASRIFQKIRVETIWAECTSSPTSSKRASECQPSWGPAHLSLRIVPWSSKLGDAIFGISFLSPEGEGTYCDVFYDSVKKLHQDWHVNIARILGHTMAHEIGHLLLGTNAHSRIGIMRPNWRGQELREIGMGTLLFTPEEARSMQNKLISLTARN